MSNSTNARLIKIALIGTVSCLKSIPSKALSCVLSTPSPMPNIAAMRSGYTMPSIPPVTLYKNRIKPGVEKIVIPSITH